ncbi:MAG TPA: aspartate-semialdehyde dehydrogenase [Deltaproteobacteria bacterium]|nr:aspartate-semialdehyde dehydrogenase [SAR324 cluster bacterium]HIA56119.1 aspartate-semialdehyde dehydrogenase [Candidatus Lambdaproteobacteria bacterium]HIN47602.1 aspartate-semialdehyde dehydrogenase [Deltaproteobacteria bacterium]HIO82764.1 aspartate-semialdehyde dehydrogenase [Deltaproteobacteria bacterium]
MKKYTFAVVGALGNVGTEMRGILETSELPIGNLVLMDVSQNAGKKVNWRDADYSVIEAKPEAFDGVDIAIMSAGAEASLELSPEAVKRGCVVIDNSTAFRMAPEHPLVIPEVNADALENHQGIIANPNCSTIQMLVALKPIHDKYTVKRVIVSTYQAVSGSGQAAVEELHCQTHAFANGEEMLASVYPHQIAFNVLPHIDVFLENGYSKEEMKMILETAKILDPEIKMTSTTVRVPVATSHSESLNIETEKAFEVEDIKTLLAASPGIVLEDDPENNVYPLAINAAGKDAVFVGRIRRDFSADNALNMWCVSDNLRKGAALNTVQIAEELVKRDLVRVP